MTTRGGHPLFHAIVSMGALLSAGCGGIERRSDGDGDGATASATGGTSGAPSGRAGGSGPLSAGGALVSLGSGGSGNAGGLSASDCASPTQYTCQYSVATVCECNPAAPLAPSNCPGTWQFDCQAWSPEPTGCRCDPDAPARAEDCSNSCAVFSCHSYAPPVGCSCVTCIR